MLQESTMQGRSWTINAIQDAVRAKGSHWFDPDTMRSFKCRVLPIVYQGPGGIYFVTSEKGPSEVREHSVRRFILPGDIGTVGEFNRLGRAAAIRQAKELAETTLQEQFHALLRTLDEAVTGADLGQTFNAAGNYPDLAEVTKGATGLIYLAGDGGYTRLLVSRYTDGSGIHLALVETGATDRKESWSAAWDHVRALANVLHAYETGSYVADTKATAEDYRAVTVLEQFLAECRKHGNPEATAANCAMLMIWAAQHHGLMVKECNEGGVYDSEGEPCKELADCRAAIGKLAKAVGAKGVDLGGDPRGCTVKLVWHDGETNDWGKEGWCVPTGEDESSED